MNESKIYSGIMGLVVGDALGVPVEFRKRGSFTIKGMTGHGTYNQPPGTWSDDSSMTLATLESIGRLGRIDPADIMANFAKWLNDGEFTPYGEVFDVGNTTAAAIGRYNRGVEPIKCGGRTVMDNGNGALMRILPLAFLNNSVEEVFNVSALTHAHKISQIACTVYLTAAKALLDGATVVDAIDLARGFPAEWDFEFSRLARIPVIPWKDIKSDGYVVHTMEAAFWCLWHTDSYRDCVLTAVNLGSDTDTTAAVAGGLAGICYGCGGKQGIPRDWIKRIPRREWIGELCDNLKS